MRSVTRRTWVHVVFISAVALGCIAVEAVSALALPEYELAWVRQLDSGGTDWSNSVAVDGSGNAYIGGYTTGGLGGQNQGSWDVFVARFGADGSPGLVSQIGTTEFDEATCVAVDATGGAYLGGTTFGSLCGPYVGGSILTAGDAFLAKFDTSGTFIGGMQPGTLDGDACNGVAVDAGGNVYMAGYTTGDLYYANQGGSDAFVIKYDSGGEVVWGKQIGTGGWDKANAVAVDGDGNVYITGYTGGNMWGASAGQYDAFLAKYSESGNLVWKRQIGTEYFDMSNSVAVDGYGNVYIAGTVDDGGPFNAHPANGFLAKYDSFGNLLWLDTMGTDDDDEVFSVATDAYGNAYVCGATEGNLGGPNAGDMDIFLAIYDYSGSAVSTYQVGSNEGDYGWGIALDSCRSIYITGQTWGSLDGSQQGGAFLVKYVPVPEAGTVMMVLTALVGMAAAMRRKI